jgi:hypothetical protein
LDRLVALKILLPDIGRDPAFAERFNREARALAKLSHPHIVAVYDSGSRGGVYYLLMEYVDGVNLRQAIQADQIPPEKALAIVPQICEALQYAHEEGVVHRDIKPENVLLDRKGRVKVADFGLAKLLGLETRDITLTGTSQAMGTLHYMAPEQYEKPQSVDHRADIYSLGVVFYELLTGKLPLGRFALPSEKVHVDVRLDQVVLKTLEREPERRYQYVSEVKTDVDSIAHSPAETRRPAAYESVFPSTRAPAAVPPESQELSDGGRLLLLLGILTLVGVPLCCAGGLIIPNLFGYSIRLLSLIAMAAIPLLLIGGVAMIIVGLMSRRPIAQADSAPPEKAAARERIDGEAALLQVRGPAWGLLALGALDSALIILLGILTGDAVARWPDFMVLTAVILQLATAIVLIVGGIRMRRLQGYGFAMFATIAAMLPVHVAWPLGVPVGIWALAVLCQSQVRRAFGVDPTVGRTSEARRAAPAIVIVLVVLAGILILPILLAGGIMVSWVSIKQPTMSPAVVMESSTGYEKTSQSVDYSVLAWTDDRPQINRLWAQNHKGIDDQQTEQLDSALADAYRSYVELEKKHTTRKLNDEGHQVVTVGMFAKELNELENKLWTKIDGIVTDNQLRGDLREKLQVRGELFPFGGFQQSIVLWKVGEWYYYHWNESNNSSPYKGPELPHNVKRFWQEPEDQKNDQ